MLGAIRESGPDSLDDDHVVRQGQPVKRQYTLKGVEAETIELMRVAAKQEGMKIGSWVSARLKHAAELALSTSKSEDGRLRIQPTLRDPGNIESRLIDVIERIQIENDKKHQAFIEMSANFVDVLQKQSEMVSVVIGLTHDLNTQKQPKIVRKSPVRKNLRSKRRQVVNA